MDYGNAVAAAWAAVAHPPMLDDRRKATDKDVFVHLMKTTTDLWEDVWILALRANVHRFCSERVHWALAVECLIIMFL